MSTQSRSPAGLFPRDPRDLFQPDRGIVTHALIYLLDRKQSVPSILGRSHWGVDHVLVLRPETIEDAIRIAFPGFECR